MAIWPLFKDRAPGRFVDIGAADGVCFSNTRGFYEAGWKGCVVEASAFAIGNLVRLYGEDPEMIVVNAAVVPEPGPALQLFHTTPDLLSSTDTAHVEKWKSQAKFAPVYQPMVAASAFFAFLVAAGVPYEYLSIDVEGSSVDLLSAAPLDQMRTEVVIVEHDGMQDRVRAMLSPLGFSVVDEYPENLVMFRPRERIAR